MTKTPGFWKWLKDGIVFQMLDSTTYLILCICSIGAIPFLVYDLFGTSLGVLWMPLGALLCLYWFYREIICEER